MSLRISRADIWNYHEIKRILRNLWWFHLNIAIVKICFMLFNKFYVYKIFIVIKFILKIFACFTFLGKVRLMASQKTTDMQILRNNSGGLSRNKKSFQSWASRPLSNRFVEGVFVCWGRRDQTEHSLAGGKLDRSGRCPVPGTNAQPVLRTTDTCPLTLHHGTSGWSLVLHLRKMLTVSGWSSQVIIECH